MTTRTDMFSIAHKITRETRNGADYRATFALVLRELHAGWRPAPKPAKVRTATYTKLRTGAWGVKVAGSRPCAGTSLCVRKRSGETKSETVQRVIWSGGGVHLCTIAATPRTSRPARRRLYSGRCRAAGCSNSSTHHAPHSRAMEGYCGWCAFDEFDC